MPYHNITFTQRKSLNHKGGVRQLTIHVWNVRGKVQIVRQQARRLELLYLRVGSIQQRLLRVAWGKIKVIVTSLACRRRAIAAWRSAVSRGCRFPLPRRAQRTKRAGDCVSSVGRGDGNVRGLRDGSWTRGGCGGQHARRGVEVVVGSDGTLLQDGLQVEAQARVRAVVAAGLELGDLERRVNLLISALNRLQLAADAVHGVVPSRGHSNIHAGGR